MDDGIMAKKIVPEQKLDEVIVDKVIVDKVIVDERDMHTSGGV